MGEFLRVYVDDRDAIRLRKIADDLGRPVEDLAEAAVSEEICRYFRNKDDPASPTSGAMPSEEG